MHVGCGRRAEKILCGPSGPVSSRTSRQRCRFDCNLLGPNRPGLHLLIRCSRANPGGDADVALDVAGEPRFWARSGEPNSANAAAAPAGSASPGQLRVFRLGSLLCRWLGWGSLKSSEFVGVGARPVKTSHGGDESNGRSLRVDARRLSSLSTTFDKGRRRTRHCQRSPRSPDRRMGIGSWDGRCGWAHAVWVPRRALLMRCR